MIDILQLEGVHPIDCRNEDGCIVITIQPSGDHLVTYPEWILKCFEKYDNGAKIVDVQDPNVVYTIKDNIEELDLITEDDLEEFKAARFKTIRDISNHDFKETTHPDLFKATDRVARLFNQKLKMLKQAIELQEIAFDKAKADGNDEGAEKAEFERKQLDVELQTLMRFKGNLDKFSRIYSYVAQLIDFGDPELENFSAFTKLLSKRLNGMSAKEIDISGLVLTGFGIFKKKVNTDGNTDHPEADGPQPLAPIQGTANGDLQPTKMTYLKEVIELIAQTFGDISNREEQVLYINHLLTILRKNDVVMAQIESNQAEEIVLQGNLPSATKGAIIKALTSHQDLSALLLKTDAQAMQNVIKVLYKLLKEGETIDVHRLT
jgi:type I restriction enzyme, R subunit